MAWRGGNFFFLIIQNRSDIPVFLPAPLLASFPSSLGKLLARYLNLSLWQGAGRPADPAAQTHPRPHGHARPFTPPRPPPPPSARRHTHPPRRVRARHHTPINSFANSYPKPLAMSVCRYLLADSWSSTLR